MAHTDQSGTEPSGAPLPTPRPGHRRSAWIAGVFLCACGNGSSFNTADGHLGLAGARSGSVFPGASGAAGAPGGVAVPSGAPGERTPQEPVTSAREVRGYIDGPGGATSSTGGATSSTGGATSSTGGATSSTGGATSSTGGATSSTGGATSSTGGATSSATLSACIEDQGSALLLRLSLLAASELSGSLQLRYPAIDDAEVEVLYSSLCGAPEISVGDAIDVTCDGVLSSGTSWDVQLSIHRDDYSPIDAVDGCGGASAYAGGVQVAP